MRPPLASKGENTMANSDKYTTDASGSGKSIGTSHQGYGNGESPDSEVPAGMGLSKGTNLPPNLAAALGKGTGRGY